MSDPWTVNMESSHHATKNYADTFSWVWGGYNQHDVPRGWENYATTIRPKKQATSVHYQGSPALPIT